MEEKICYIVGACSCENLNIQRKTQDFIIAADGGLNTLEKLNIIPDLVIGDFDSLNRLPTAYDYLKLPVEKDLTDTLACVKEGINRGYKTFYIYGGVGGRVDHTIANLQTLNYLAKNELIGYLFSDIQVITTLTRGERGTFCDKAKGIISVFSAESACEKVTVKGLKYQIENYSLENSFPIGVSNEFISENSEIYCEKGILYLVFSPENLIYFERRSLSKK